MPAPLAPLAVTALKFGTVAAITWIATRRADAKPKHVWREAALDECPDGLELTKDHTAAEQNLHGSARMTRRVSLPGGRRVEIDFASITRIRLRNL